MSSSTGNGSTTSGFYRAIDGHLCTHENCALRTSRKSGNYGRRFLGCSQFNVGPKCGFFQWVDNETCRSETAPLVRERISMLENELQLVNQREMRSREMEERSNQREREAHELYVEAREELKKIRESERLYKLALVLSWLFFIFVMLLLCFASMNNNVRVRTLNLP
ncbi:hypothetical protein SO802_029307 [Lithocarpus litseifolius]|uniref:GRF-type domain-containing protein n=1 Tax=Lithocarpus litseifolius TaxID=425828 RepID=A0AAW2BUF7_9ROSI